MNLKQHYQQHRKTYLKHLSYQLFGEVEAPNTTQFYPGDPISWPLQLFMEQQALMSNLTTVKKALNALTNHRITPTVALNKVMYTTVANTWLKRPTHRDDIVNALQTAVGNYRVISQAHLKAAQRNPKNFYYNLANDVTHLQNDVSSINHPNLPFVHVVDDEIHPVTTDTMQALLTAYQTALLKLWHDNDAEINNHRQHP